MDEKPNIKINDGDEIVIVVPQTDDDELVIDLDELGIDIESLGENVNIVIQVEGEDGEEMILEPEGETELIFDDDEVLEPNEWYFDDDPYGIVYYEFP